MVLPLLNWFVLHQLSTFRLSIPRPPSFYFFFIQSFHVCPHHLKTAQPSRVSFIDRVTLLWCDIETIDEVNGPADIGRALFRIKGRVGAKKHMFRAEKLEPQDCCVPGTEKCRINIKHLEIIEMVPLQPFQHQREVLIGRSCTQLIPSRDQPSLQNTESSRPCDG